MLCRLEGQPAGRRKLPTPLNWALATGPRRSCPQGCQCLENMAFGLEIMAMESQLRTPAGQRSHALGATTCKTGVGVRGAAQGEDELPPTQRLCGDPRCELPPRGGRAICVPGSDSRPAGPQLEGLGRVTDSWAPAPPAAPAARASVLRT